MSSKTHRYAPLRRGSSAAACCLLWWTAGCFPLPSASGAAPSAFPAGPTIAGSSGQQPGTPRVVAATYQVAPNLHRLDRLQPRPASLARALFGESPLGEPPFEGRCQPLPLGLQDVLDVPDGVPGPPLGRLGPFEAGVQGLPVSPLRLPGYLAGLNEGRWVDGGAVLADRGYACGFRAFLYVRITRWGTEPVAVNR